MERYLEVMVVLLLCFLFAVTTEFNVCGGNSDVICRGKEREALLSFKRGIRDPENKLSSWRGVECCLWEGVGCHSITGHVLKLHLPNLFLDGDISSSLMELNHLSYLDLSWNRFNLIGIPEFIGSLVNLRYLNLSNAGFGGPIPHHLGNLSRLRYLDIGNEFFATSNPLSVTDLEWISGLTSIKFLDMTRVNLSKASNWLQVTNKLHSLSVLRLSYCELDSTGFLPHVNFSSLVTLDLSYNNFISSEFDWFSSLFSLVTLDLSSNQIHGPIPRGFGNMTSLRFLDLSHNSFTSKIPDWLCHVTTIQRLEFSGNKFHGKLPSGIENLTSLTYLDLSGNDLEGEILPSLGSLCTFQLLNFSHNKQGKGLEFLDIGWNNLSGHLPKQLSHCKSLFYLSISRNSFSGPIPMSIGGLSSLKYLDISENSFKGVVTEEHFSNLTKLNELWAFSNLLTLQVSSGWIPPFQLKLIDLRSWNLGPQFPSWLQTQQDLEYLDISNTGISDVLPTWFGSLFNWCGSSCSVNLSYNQFRGNITSLPFGGTVNLASNNFTGPLPQLSSHVTGLDLSDNLFSGSLSLMLCRRINEGNSLEKLDLSGNLLSRELPDCWMYWTELGRLNLGDNEFTGSVPSSMASLLYLTSLHLHNNYLSGNLLPLKNCSQLMIVDLSENELFGSVPMWIGNNLSNLVVLILSSNKFNGSIPSEFCHLESLQILDLSSNNLSGNIPRCFGNFSSMVNQPNSIYRFYYNTGSRGEMFMDTESLVVKRTRNEYSTTLGLLTGISLSGHKLSGEIPGELTGLHSLIFLNLSENHLQGKIPVGIGSMKSLESLDLSMNRLSGVIPQSMASIFFLSHLNLSYNYLSGKIPSGTQIQGFSPSSFIGNSKLCGPPLTHNCPGEDVAEGPTQDLTDEEDGGRTDMKWFYMSMPLGFVVGFGAVLGTLALNKSWMYAYFQFMEEMKYKLLGWCL